jgi:proteasome lid subunit RPN8/RPN11
MFSLLISQNIFQAMLAHLASVYPMEGCGLLAGVDGRIDHLYPITNWLNSPVAFEMVPEELVGAIVALETQGLSLLAIYHSHPQGPAAPSPTDIAQANYPEAVQIIVSLSNLEQPEAKGFLIENGRVSPVSLKIV